VPERPLPWQGGPAKATKAHSALLTGGSQLGAWRRHLSGAEMERGMEIRGLFGLDSIY